MKAHPKEKGRHTAEPGGNRPWFDGNGEMDNEDGTEKMTTSSVAELSPQKSDSKLEESSVQDELTATLPKKVKSERSGITEPLTVLVQSQESQELSDQQPATMEKVSEELLKKIHELEVDEVTRKISQNVPLLWVIQSSLQQANYLGLLIDPEFEVPDGYSYVLLVLEKNLFGTNLNAPRSFHLPLVNVVEYQKDRNEYNQEFHKISELYKKEEEKVLKKYRGQWILFTDEGVKFSSREHYGWRYIIEDMNEGHFPSAADGLITLAGSHFFCPDFFVDNNLSIFSGQGGKVKEDGEKVFVSKKTVRFEILSKLKTVLGGTDNLLTFADAVILDNCSPSTSCSPAVAIQAHVKTEGFYQNWTEKVAQYSHDYSDKVPKYLEGLVEPAKKKMLATALLVNKYVNATLKVKVAEKNNRFVNRGKVYINVDKSLKGKRVRLGVRGFIDKITCLVVGGQQITEKWGEMNHPDTPRKQPFHSKLFIFSSNLLKEKHELVKGSCDAAAVSPLDLRDVDRRFVFSKKTPIVLWGQRLPIWDSYERENIFPDIGSPFIAVHKNYAKRVNEFSELVENSKDRYKVKKITFGKELEAKFGELFPETKVRTLSGKGCFIQVLTGTHDVMSMKYVVVLGMNGFFDRLTTLIIGGESAKDKCGYSSMHFFLEFPEKLLKGIVSIEDLFKDAPRSVVQSVENGEKHYDNPEK